MWHGVYAIDVVPHGVYAVFLFFFQFFGRFEFLYYFFTVCFINLLFALLFALSIYCARVGRRLSLGCYKYHPRWFIPASPRAKEREREREERREKREEKEEKEEKKCCRGTYFA